MRQTGKRKWKPYIEVMRNECFFESEEPTRTAHAKLIKDVHKLQTGQKDVHIYNPHTFYYHY